MPFVLVATDLVHDAAIENVYARTLRDTGFTVEVVRPMMQAASAIETIAKSSGKLDAVVLAHHGAMSSSSTNPFEAARSIRRMDSSLAFVGAVRARAVPIVAVAERMAFPDQIDIEWFDLTSPFVFDQHPEALIAGVFGAIEGWRQSLLQELEYVGYAVTVGADGKLDVSHTLVRRRREGEILTDEATPGSLRSGQYLILAQDVLQEFAPSRPDFVLRPRVAQKLAPSGRCSTSSSRMTSCSSARGFMQRYQPS